MQFEDLNIDHISEADVVFLAVPHGASMDLVSQLLDLDIKIIDLSADFRIKDPKIYERYYREHTCPELLEEAVYGVPELRREMIKEAKLVANPGCIAVTAILGLAPVIKIVNHDYIIIDAKIGSSAAGETPTQASHHPERNNVVRIYKPTGHRHTAEIEQEVGLIANKPVKVGLTPHAVGMVRGLLVTIYTYFSREIEDKDVWRALRTFYRDEYFIRVVKEKKILHGLPNPKILVGSNFCDIGFSLDGHTNRLIMFSALDNLIKGAAGNAVQNMNLMFGLREEIGLHYASLHP